MRIAHVVTFVDQAGTFGGPVTVARQQAAALRARGHSVDLFAGAPARDFSTPQEHLYPAYRHRGSLSVMTSPRLLAAVATGLLTSYDIVHVHLSRDLLTLPIARWLALRAQPFAVQPHGMIQPDNRLSATALDRALVRPSLRRAQQVFALTTEEAAGISEVAGQSVDVRIIRNGIDLPGSDLSPRWSPVPEILYCARLHPRKRPRALVEAAAILLRQGFDFKLTIAGSDEGEAQAVEQDIEERGLTHVARYIGPLRPMEVRRRMSQSQVFVLPSVDEPFPMSVLEAMSLGLPTVITNSTGISDELSRSFSAMVSGGSPQELAEGILAAASNPADWSVWSAKQQELCAQLYSIDAVATQLLESYSRANAS